MPETTTPDGVTMAYETVGAGPPLVLVHGITESRRSWDPLVADLAVDHTLVVVDLPGHGESGPAPVHDIGTYAAAVAHVVGHLGLTSPLVVGHSLGGLVATAYGSFSMPCGIVNIDQPLALAGFKDALAPLAPMLRGGRDEFEGAVAAVFEAMAGALPAAERARLAAIRRPDQDVVLALWAPVLDAPAEALEALVRDIGARVSAPYLSLHGIDPGADYPGWLADVVPGATVEVWPDLGHYPHLVDPARFLARLAAFEATLA